MSWVTATWSAAIAASVILAVPNVLVWLQDRTARAHLLLALATMATAGVGVCEFLLMRADTPERYGLVLRWAQVPVTGVVLGLVGFVRVYLDAGRPWLGWAVIGTRVLGSLVVNFLSPQGVIYTAIVSLRPVRLFGETVSTAEGIQNPWLRVNQLSTALMLAFFLDAAVMTWRRGDRRRAVIVCGSMVFYGVVAMVHPALIHAGKVKSPYFLTFGFLGIMAAMSHLLAEDVLRARALARRLQVSESEARESEERLSLAVKAASLGIWVCDIAKDDVWASSTVVSMPGHGDSERVTLARFLGSVHPDDREGVRESIERSLAGRSEFEREYRVLSPEGNVRWIASRGAVERDAAGTALRMRGVSLDITPRKAAEAELLRQHEQLAHLSRVTMVSELSSSFAHELNQPLTAILSNAQAAQRLLERDPPDLGEVREILGDVVKEDKHARDVILRLRGLLRKGEVRRQRLDLSEVVENVLRIVRSDLVNKNVTVSVETEPGLPSVTGDRVQLEQVLLNLIVNGCDAMAGEAPGQRRLRVRTERSEGGSVHVSVEDRGVGIPGHRLAVVFEPFFTTKPDGIGLGLAVCRTIVEAHGGEIWASNNAGGAPGATVHFRIPVDAEGA